MLVMLVVCVLMVSSVQEMRVRLCNQRLNNGVIFAARRRAQHGGGQRTPNGKKRRKQHQEPDTKGFHSEKKECRGSHGDKVNTRVATGRRIVVTTMGRQQGREMRPIALVVFTNRRLTFLRWQP